MEILIRDSLEAAAEVAARVVKKIIDIKSFLPTTRYSIKNLNEIRKYLLKIKKILIGIDPDEIFQEDYFDERMFKYKVKLFEPYKSIGGQYDVWLDFIEQMIKSIDSENRKKYMKHIKWVWKDKKFAEN